jgi:IS5 family transposase
MTQKKKYRIRNWAEYNKGLIKRGSLTVWLEEESIANWHPTKLTGERGHPVVYSDIAIQCALTLRIVFHLSLRATKGFLGSLIKLLDLPIKAPDYSTLSRRQDSIILPRLQGKNKDPLHVVIDSTGIKIYGEGEWKMRQHGKEKRRTWRKLHVAVDEKTGEIVAASTTEANVHDCEIIADLLEQITSSVSQVTGDGAYDTHECYDATLRKKAKPCFPPRKNAVRHKPSDESWRIRNRAIGDIEQKGMKKWKEKNNYHRRSLAETTMFRLKKIFGGQASSRQIKNQSVELALRCHALNKMTQLGMPDSVRI